jgi:hypothetical protein
MIHKSNLSQSLLFKDFIRFLLTGSTIDLFQMNVTGVWKNILGIISVACAFSKDQTRGLISSKLV